MAMANSIFDIPEEVIRTSLLPLLSVNELLRTRRVCKWLKWLSEDHLSRHPRSRDMIEIDLSERRHLPIPEDGTDNGVRREMSLLSFLREEEQLAESAAEAGLNPPIRLPISRFILGFGSEKDFCTPQLNKFLQLYGDQVKDLHIRRDYLWCLSENEVNFYRQLPNLEHFSLQQNSVYGLGHVKAPGVGEIAKVLQGFSKLRTLKIQDIFTFPVSELLELCTNIRTLDFRNFFGGPTTCLLEILNQNQHKKLEILDTRHIDSKMMLLCVNKQPYYQLMSDWFCLLVKLKNLKLTNVTTGFFDGMNETQRNILAPRILSVASKFRVTDPLLQHDSIINMECLPSVEACHIDMDFNNTSDNQEPLHTIIARNLSLLAKKMPSLRKLKIFINDHQNSTESSKALARIWSNFPNLEEIYFVKMSYPVLQDVAFIGEDQDLPFLQLTKLKILHLGIVDMDNDHACSAGEQNSRNSRPVTDDSFVRVFSQMKLHEFRFGSIKPLPEVTVAGIRALRAGPFGETIRKFPFDTWSLENVSPEELLLLSQEFACNTF